MAGFQKKERVARGGGPPAGLRSEPKAVLASLGSEFERRARPEA